MTNVEAQKGVLRPQILTNPVPACKNYNSLTRFQPTECLNNHNTDSTIINVPRNIKNVPRNKPSSIQTLERAGITTAYIEQNALITGKYLPPALVQSLMLKHQKKVVLLRAGLGVGKSTALAASMQTAFNGRGVAICHRVGLTRQLSTTFQADYYQEVKREGGKLSERLASTIHSLPEMLRVERSVNAFQGGLLVIDESNSVAAEIITDVIKNEALTIQSIGKAIQKSGVVVCADAHLDLSTVALLNAAGIENHEMLLIVVKKPELAGYTVKIWDDEHDDKGKSLTKPAFINQILADIGAGLKVIVTSLSATFLEELDREADKQGFNSRILVTSKTPLAIRESLTADSYQQIQLTMLSPAMSTGISFDRTITTDDGRVMPCPTYRHADRSYVVLSNAKDTGTHQDGLQAMLRERAVNDKTIRCFYQEAPVPLPALAQVAKGYESQFAAVRQSLLEIGGNDLLNQVMGTIRPNQDKAEAFMVSQALKVAEEKLEFLPLFIQECEAKGATIQECKLSDLAQGHVTSDTLQAEKKRIRAEWVDARVNAPKLDDSKTVDTADELLMPALDRRYIESKAVVDFDQLEPSERAEWVERILPEQGEKSLLSTVREWERALADKTLLTEVVKAALVGISGGNDDRIRFLEKTTTSKAHWLSHAKYTNLLLKTAGVTNIAGELVVHEVDALTDKSIKSKSHPAYGLYTSLNQNPKPAIVCGLLPYDTDIAKVKASPLMAIVAMLGSVGIKLRKSRNRDEYRVIQDSIEPTLAMINRRRDAGINELQERIDGFTEYLNNYRARKFAESERDERNSRAIPTNVIEAATIALNELEHPEKLDEALEYLEPFFGRIQAGKLTHIAINFILKKWLFEAVLPVDNYANGLQNHDLGNTMIYIEKQGL